MRTDTLPTISRQDYQPYPYRIEQVRLEFDLAAEQTEVSLQFRASSLNGQALPLILDGDDIELLSVSLDGVALAPQDYQLTDQTLTLHPGKPEVEVALVSRCRPKDNTSLMGLYVSGQHLFTQCEAQGFRRITFFPDRPDVMARYEVVLRADPARYPTLLSNGNLLHTVELEDGRRQATWQDPFPKPSYLFALVAGDFDLRERTISKADGSPALLQVYCDRGDGDKTEWAIQCLENSVRWDEQRFGLDLDLDRFMIVAARDFNMGAMENKGLNIFNAAYVLADPQSTTDASFRAVEAVIGHEYFHNWTGNRVTCRDWFQLSLKEGLTVFRDQEFSGDMLAHGLDGAQAASARAVKRIDDVSVLRAAQFPEDAGPMAHPIRPESYQEISNFYTATVYEKGAEVIRMQHTLLGEDGFQAGMREYFRRHDGQAVTCDDFVDAMDSVYRERHPGRDLTQFRRWYEQAGTPRVSVSLQHDPASRTCTLTLRQSNPPVGIEPKSAVKPALHIPFALGMLDQEGRPLTLHLDGRSEHTLVLDFTEQEQSWTFTQVPQTPVLSLLRNFSAPVRIEYYRPDAELALLARHDPDPFARWEAAQLLATRLILARAAGRAPSPAQSATLVQTWHALLQDAALSPAYKARILALPSERELLEQTQPMTPRAIVQARLHVQKELGLALTPYWQELYQYLNLDQPDYSPDAMQAGARSLRNLALAYLMAAGVSAGAQLARNQYDKATNMTDRMGALSVLVNYGSAEDRQDGLEDFFQRWQHNPLVLDRWFTLQATAPSTGVAQARALMLHPAFSLRNPNRARSLIFQFCINNLQGVHSPEGYDFWAEQVIALDKLNPEISARLARVFDNWARFEPEARDGLKAALERIQAEPGLSGNVGEIVHKALTL
ncbi:aminopeptidase N [Alcaligenes sp. WGS1538]|uniref:aminopeptidase N n=1 Tax=Alcaligenes sp. WGS1538 TaxID=3366811 RepID=UPI00372D1EF0